MRICLVATAIALVSCPSIGLAQGTSGSFLAPSMMIHGQGRVEVPPDYANVTVEVEMLTGQATSHRRSNRRVSRSCVRISG